jgi:hypothetical protein
LKDIKVQIWLYRHQSMTKLQFKLKLCDINVGKGKGKAIHLQAWTGPESSRRLGFPDFKAIAHEGGKVVSPTHRPPSPPGYKRRVQMHNYYNLGS